MNKNYYITTPIYYPSAKPHMGHAYSSIIADFFARFKKIDGFNVYFLTGTDEHGLKIQRSAEKLNKDPKSFCDEISKTFEDLTKTLNLSNTDFIRTTEDRHKVSVQNLWNILSSGSAVEWVEEESFFFKLSEWEKPLLDFYEKNKNFILPESRRNEVISFVKSGLKDLSVSRKTFSWGVKVPSDENHVVYVWLDALTNYLSSLKYPDENNELYKNFWPADLHIIGKDILRFHAIYWPAFLLAAKIEPPKRVYGHGWILSGDEKMSKSKGNILDPLEIINVYGLDPLRYYLLKEVSFGNDGNISEEKLENCINSDLANNFGNLCQRVLSFAEKNCSSLIPDHKYNDEDLEILKPLNNLDKIRSFIDNQDINQYMSFIVDRLFAANKYFNDQEPWKKKDDRLRLNTIVYTALELIRKITILLYPVMPETSVKVLNVFNETENSIDFTSIDNNEILKKDLKINKLDILFKKIEK